MSCALLGLVLYIDSVKDLGSNEKHAEGHDEVHPFDGRIHLQAQHSQEGWVVAMGLMPRRKMVREA